MIEDKLINLSDVDQTIYRVIDFKHLLNLFKTGDLLFTRPNKWEDPFENCLLKLNTIQKSTGKKIGLRGLLDIFFGLCWSLGAKETDATWRIYAPNKNGVRISQQRKGRKKGQISEDRIRRLNEICFDWGKSVQSDDNNNP